MKALDRGEQVMLLRKGGIREEGKDFRVIHPEFLLYPTFEHQKDELLQEKYHQDLQQVLSEAQGGDTITFSHWAGVEEVIELTEQDKLDNLSPYHIWSDDYAQKRLHWKPRSPLSVMLLRLYRLEEPQTVPYLPSYSGCKSWVELSEDVPLGHLTPVLAEDDFRSKVGEVKAALGLSPSYKFEGA
ncbi:MAG: DUF1802 family protein [Dehalococcoidia bacterium]|nr:DUF1802 family protein [Dehalococcoidia bacterium]